MIKRPLYLKQLVKAKRKAIVVAGPIPTSRTEEGFEVVNVVDFLLSLD